MLRRKRRGLLRRRPNKQLPLNLSAWPLVISVILNLGSSQNAALILRIVETIGQVPRLACRTFPSKEPLARNFHRVPNTPRQAVRVCIDDAIPGSHIVMVDGKGAPGRAVGYRIVLHLAGIVAHLKQELGGAKQQRVGGAKVI